jgi:hypothetical protein
MSAGFESQAASFVSAYCQTAKTVAKRGSGSLQVVEPQWFEEQGVRAASLFESRHLRFSS